MLHTLELIEMNKCAFGIYTMEEVQELRWKDILEEYI